MIREKNTKKNMKKNFTEEWRKVSADYLKTKYSKKNYYLYDYYVSNTGKVRVEAHDIKVTRKNGKEYIKHSPAQTLKQSISNAGYMQTSIGPVHMLVANCFPDQVPINSEYPGEEINHIDGCKAHNDVSNLEFISKIGNMKAAGPFIAAQKKGKKYLYNPKTGEQRMVRNKEYAKLKAEGWVPGRYKKTKKMYEYAQKQEI